MSRARIALSSVALASLVSLASLGCGGAGSGAWPRVVQPRAVDAASGAPHVERVRDLGEPAPFAESGALPGSQADGKFTIGEYVLVEGEDFGKLPTVLIGGRPARVLARTAGGGIVSQIPSGVSGGATPVEVSHPAGRHAISIEVTRYAVVLQPDASTAHFLAVSATDAQPAGAASVDAPRVLRFSADGAWAYVVGGAQATGLTPASVRPTLGEGTGIVVSTVALTAPGGPKVVHSTRSKLTVVDVALAGKLLVVVSPTHLQLFALDEPRTPAPYDAVALPPEIAAGYPIAADLSPDGQTLALLLEDNRVAFFSLATPEAPAYTSAIDLLPGKRLPLARDLRFDAAGALWVITGDSPRSLAVGHQPTRLVGLKAGEGGAYARGATVEVAGGGPPLAIMPAPRESLRSATTIGDTADDLPIFVTAIDQKLLLLHGGGAAAAGELAQGAAALAEPGQIVRTDAAGRGGPLPALPGVVTGAIALTPDATLVLATAWSFAPAGPRFGVWLAGAGGGAAAPRFIELGAVPAAPVYLPASLGELAVQP